MKKFSDAKIESALRALGGIMSVAAQALHDATGTKISRQAIRERVLRSPRLRRAIEEAEEASLDLAESKLMQAIDAGDINATKFFLETRGKRRGFSRRDIVVTARTDPKKLSDWELDAALEQLEAQAQALTIDLEPVEPPRALPPPRRRSRRNS